MKLGLRQRVAKAIRQFAAFTDQDDDGLYQRRRRSGEYLRATLWQHPVGQGLFHSGEIVLRGCEPFRYVYDCGKYQAKSADWPLIIGPALTEYSRRRLDALFVSHFDVDHINGLSFLLDAFGGAERAFLPYLNPVTRLIIAARDLARGVELSADQTEFLDDPAKYLVDHGVQNVIYVNSDDGGPDNEFPPDPDDTPRELVHPELFVRTRAAVPADLAPQDRGTPVRIMRHGDPIAIRGNRRVDWILQTYVHSDPDVADSVHATIRAAFGQAGLDALIAGEARCAEVLRDPNQRKLLAAAYKTAVGLQKVRWRDLPFRERRAKQADHSRMNRTSMSLFSGPHFYDRETYPGAYDPVHWFTRGGVSDDSWSRGPRGRNGWLLTGDAVLGDEQVLNRFVRFFQQRRVDYLARTMAFTVPHHGSERNFSHTTLIKLGAPPIAVIPAGNKTHFKHPSNNVLKLIRGQGVEVMHVHERTENGFVHTLVV